LKTTIFLLACAGFYLLFSEDLKALEIRIYHVTLEIESHAAQDAAARRLMSIPGIRPLGATALLAAIGGGKQFANARDLTSWLGLVPRQHSAGGKPTFLGIGKRGILTSAG
jgi:transposase